MSSLSRKEKTTTRIKNLTGKKKTPTNEGKYIVTIDQLLKLEWRLKF